MIACRGRLQRDGGVTHLIAEHLMDLSPLLRSLSNRDEAFLVQPGRGDEARIGTRDRLRPGAKEMTDRLDDGVMESVNEPTIRLSVRDFR